MVLNKTVPLSLTDLAGKDDLHTLCDKESSPMYDVVESPADACYSKFTVRVVVCATSKSVVGNYSVVWGYGNSTGSGVNLKLSSASSGTETMRPYIICVPYTPYSKKV